MPYMSAAAGFLACRLIDCSGAPQVYERRSSVNMSFWLTLRELSARGATLLINTNHDDHRAHEALASDLRAGGWTAVQWDEGEWGRNRSAAWVANAFVVLVADAADLPAHRDDHDEL